MKKKLLLGLLIIMSLFLVTGCGKDEGEPVENNETNEVEKDATGSSDTLNDVELYSDDTKYVFQYQNITHIFYYDGDEITGHHTYINYNDHASAEAAYSMYNLAELEDMDAEADRVYVSGKYLVFELNESEYENMTVSDVKTAYSYMTELKKGN